MTAEVRRSTGTETSDREMRNADIGGRSHAAGLGGPLAYLGVWLAAGLLVAALAVVLLGQGTAGPRTVVLPPVRAIALAPAARKARCEVDARRPLRGIAGARTAEPSGRIYDRPVRADLRERAVRRGLIVIEYRRGMAGTALDTLKAVQHAVPAGTILAPSGSALRDDVTATSFRHRLRCAQISPATYDALLLFRGRYLGSVAPG